MSERLDYLRTRKRELDSAEVSYERTGIQVTGILATCSELRPDEMIPYGVPLDSRRREYLINVDALEDFGEPVQGDLIIDGTVTCTVAPFGDEPCFRYTGHLRRSFRIHTVVSGQ